MNLIEALRSGKRFKRKGWTMYIDANLNLTNLWPTEAVLADDWEIQEEKVEFTRSSFINAIAEYNRRNGSMGYGLSINPQDFDNFLTELGFK